MTYTVEPTDHWRTGDRAYCVRGLKKDGRYIVETGRIYSVSEVKRLQGMMSDGLKLAGVETGDVWGFWSNRFACIRGRELAFRQITNRCRFGWLDAYAECRDARSAIAIEASGRDGDRLDV